MFKVFLKEKEYIFKWESGFLDFGGFEFLENYWIIRIIYESLFMVLMYMEKFE